MSGVAEELVELATEDGAVDMFFGKERWVGRGYEKASGRRWGHEHGWAGPYIVGWRAQVKRCLPDGSMTVIALSCPML